MVERRLTRGWHLGVSEEWDMLCSLVYSNCAYSLGERESVNIYLELWILTAW